MLPDRWLVDAPVRLPPVERPPNATEFGEPHALASGVSRENVTRQGPWLAPSAHKVSG